jgi:hypothetical protein
MVIISNSLTYEVILESNISERDQNYILLKEKWTASESQFGSATNSW